MSKKKMKPAGATTTTTVHDLPDHILERILLHLGPSPCLVRAAAACRGWCSVVADAGFLARLRSAHPHGTRLGHYHGGRQKPTVFVPFSPAAAIVGHHRLRFNLDLLPGGGGSWELLDSRDSLLLLAKLALASTRLDLLVYEPLTGRHRLFIGSGRLASCFADAYLVDGGNGDDSCRIGRSAFRVLAVMDQYVAGEYVAPVFSSGNDGGLHLVPANKLKRSLGKMELVGRANGSIYWRIRGRAAVIALDECTALYSIVQLPANIWGAPGQHSRVTGGEDGALRIVRLMSNKLKVFVRRAGDNKWVLEKQLELPDEATMIPTPSFKYVILAPMVTKPGDTWLFKVELDTLRVEHQDERNIYNEVVYPYELPWPPVLPDITWTELENRGLG